jgi:hypothetical protein
LEFHYSTIFVCLIGKWDFRREIWSMIIYSVLRLYHFSSRSIVYIHPYPFWLRLRIIVMSTLYSTNTFRTNQYFSLLLFLSYYGYGLLWCPPCTRPTRSEPISIFSTLNPFWLRLRIIVMSTLYSTNTFRTNQYLLYFYSFLTTVTDYCDVHLVLNQHVQNQSVFSLLLLLNATFCTEAANIIVIVFGLKWSF